MGAENSKSPSQEADVLKKTADVEFHERVVRETRSVNVALVLDENGTYKKLFPTFRDPETKKQNMIEKKFRAILVPPDQVIRYMGTPVREVGMTPNLLASHSASLEMNGRRYSIVFDRTYTYGGTTYDNCAWIPNTIMRAGVMYEKKFDKIRRRVIAVLKRLGGSNTVAYQVIGNKEADQRALHRVYVDHFITKRSPAGDDSELERFMYDAIGSIPEEEVNT